MSRETNKRGVLKICNITPEIKAFLASTILLDFKQIPEKVLSLLSIGLG